MQRNLFKGLPKRSICECFKNGIKTYGYSNYHRKSFTPFYISNADLYYCLILWSIVNY